MPIYYIIIFTSKAANTYKPLLSEDLDFLYPIQNFAALLQYCHMEWFILPMPICIFLLAVRHTLVQLTVAELATFPMFSSIYPVSR